MTDSLGLQGFLSIGLLAEGLATLLFSLITAKVAAALLHGKRLGGGEILSGGPSALSSAASAGSGLLFALSFALSASSDGEGLLAILAGFAAILEAGRLKRAYREIKTRAVFYRKALLCGNRYLRYARIEDFIVDGEAVHLRLRGGRLLSLRIDPGLGPELLEAVREAQAKAPGREAELRGDNRRFIDRNL